MTRDRIKKGLAWSMTLIGVVGFVLSACGLVAKSEPRFVLLLSWAAIFEPGIVGLIAADDN